MLVTALKASVRSKNPVIREFLVICGVLALVFLLEATIDLDDKIVEWIFKNKDTVFEEVAVNSIIAGILLAIYTFRRLADYKRLFTVQAKTEAMLNESRQHLEMILDNSATILYTSPLDQQAGTTYISRNVTAILGYEPAEFKKPQFWLSIIHPSDAAKIFSSMHVFFENGSFENEFRIKQKNGTWRWIYNKMVLMQDKKSQQKEIIGTWLDITDRKKSQESIRLSEERFQIAAKATNDGIFDCNFKTFNTWQNENAFLNFGYTPQQEPVTFDWWINKIHPEDYERVMLSIHKTLAEKSGNWNCEYRFRRQNGSYADVLDRCSVIYSDNGKALRSIGTRSDLTVTRRTEKELNDAKCKAELSAKAKAEFLANMSHEIRTPLNGIIGMTDMVLETTQLSTDQSRYMNIIKSSSETLLALINDILDFSKIDAGKLQLSPVNFSLRDEIPKALQLFSLKASEKNLELIYRIHHNVPNQLTGDIMRIRQIITNLISNAVKFTEKGEVVMSIALQSALEDEVVLQFTVSDTGIGIPEHKLSAIFDEFSQADNSTSRKYGGTGLGLSITKRLTEMMGGSVWVESKEGIGSHFQFTLKLKTQGLKQASRFIPSQALHNRPVLVVEDNKSSSQYMIEILNHFDMKPVPVTDGSHAMKELKKAIFEKNPYPVILLDISLPGSMDGYDVAAAVKNDPLLKNTEIIVISMSQKASDRERFARIGITEFFTKPLSQSDLLNSIQNALIKISSGNSGIYNENEYMDNNDLIPEQIKTDMKILLVEDNKVNQEVVGSMLLSRGYAVTIAENGEEAVNAVQQDRFDTVLMDVQMPVMNGYEATSKIRAMEKQTGRHLYIIGLTANAIQGDREKCLAAGMDEYLSKPVNMKQLFDAILKGRNNNTSAETYKKEVSVSMPVNFQKLMEKLSGSHKVLSSCMTIFEKEVPEIIHKIDLASQSQHAEEIKSLCHGLRGSLLTMEMHAASAVAGRIENFAEQKKFTEISGLMPSLKKEVTQASAYIYRYL